MKIEIDNRILKMTKELETINFIIYMNNYMKTNLKVNEKIQNNSIIK